MFFPPQVESKQTAGGTESKRNCVRLWFDAAEPAYRSRLWPGHSPACTRLSPVGRKTRSRNKFTATHAQQIEENRSRCDSLEPQPHLSSRFPAAVLPALLEARVPVGPDDAVVQSGTVNEAHGVFGISSGVVSGAGAAKECHLHFVFKFILIQSKLDPHRKNKTVHKYE